MAMMIRINLLPTRGVKKREAGRQVLVLGAALLLLAFAGNYFWYQARADVEAENNRRIEETRTQIAQLERVIGEVNDINRRKKDVEDKLKILDGLKKARSGPVRLLDALASSTPPTVWLGDFEESNTAVRLLGQAESHDAVAELMRSLSNIVWTPKGMARIIEQKRSAPTVRVELIQQNGAIEDMPVGQVTPFFTGIDLRKAEQTGAARETRVSFEIAMKANYAT